MNSDIYKALSVREFTKAAEQYDGDRSGIYSMCRRDYPDVLAELEKEPFGDVLDCGCGTGPILSLLCEEHPQARYTGIDLTPKMIEVAKRKKLPGVRFVLGDCEELPFEADAFDAVICCQSFHHYPNPQCFFNGVCRVLRPGGRLILRDMTAPSFLLGLFNRIEIPLLNRMGRGDVHVYGAREIQMMCEDAGLKMERFEMRKGFRLHCMVRKPGK